MTNCQELEALGAPLFVHDVAISWAHPFEWQVGQVLYHGPAALKLPILRSGGGRHWVSLAQVAGALVLRGR
eukprot:g27133.t1